jgi:TRAP-type C4-dicarboxylate transport system permease small subunit
MTPPFLPPPGAPAPPPLLRATRDGGLKGRVDTALGWTVAALMGLSVLNVLWQVASRYVLGAPSAFTDEAARFLLIWVSLLGAAYASGQRLHLAIDLLPRALHGRARARLGLALQGAVALFALVVMVGGGLRLVGLSFLLGQRSAALGLPLGAVYLVLPLAGVLIAYYAAEALRDPLRTLRGAPPRRAEADEPSAHAFAAHERAVARPREDA